MTEVSGTILGFDFGLARTGVAVGETSTGSAHPLDTIHTTSKDERFARIAAFIREWQPVALVVGLPVHADGTAHEMTRMARNFAIRLKRRAPTLPIFMVDERHTSLIADAQIHEMGIYGKRGKMARDQLAALQIMQTFLDSGGIALESLDQQE